MGEVVQYIIVRGDLERLYGSGVLATQVAHAALAPISNQLRSHLSTATLDEILDAETSQWLGNCFKKIVLSVRSADELEALDKLLLSRGIVHSLIQESTLGGEPTAIGLKPYPREEVAEYFESLPLLGRSPTGKKKQVTATVNGIPVDSGRFAYDAIQLDAPPSRDLGDRFILTVDYRRFMERFGKVYDSSKGFYEREGRGTGDAEMNGGPLPPLSQIRVNDPALARYLLNSFKQEILDSVIPATRKTPIYSITSIDGIFCLPENVHIFGGCARL